MFRQHTKPHENLQIKRKIVPVHNMKAFRGRKIMGSFILNLGIR